MKTHINNTQAISLKNDNVSHAQFLNHQKALHSNIKPLIDNKRKEQIKIVKNNKTTLYNNPNQHVNQLFKSLHSKPIKSTLNNKQTFYDEGKQLLNDRIKKNKREKHAKQQHDKELRSMNDRIKNCKNLQQRKKDKTDPITNPTYFIKKGQQVKDVTIGGFCQKIMNKNRPQSSKPPKRENEWNYLTYNSPHQKALEKPSQNLNSVPDYGKTRPQTAAQTRKNNPVEYRRGDLPGCTFNEIMAHIIDNKIYKQVDIKVLYVRLCHQYSEQKVDDIWEYLMDELEK